METPKQIKEAEAAEAIARQAEPMHPEVSQVGNVVHFVFHAIREYDFPFGIYQAQPPITPSVRHVNRTRHGEGWHHTHPGIT